ncbi:peptide ABC transporter ATP-binding protein, partial [bacterium]|nr:peptide ABC transporter ATP-binding protein [bacterium]
VMYLGKMVEKGRTEEVVQHPAHPYTMALLSAVPIPDPQMRRNRVVLPGEIPDPVNPPSGCPFHPRCRYARKMCLEMEPKLKDLGDDHLIACHLIK